MEDRHIDHYPSADWYHSRYYRVRSLTLVIESAFTHWVRKLSCVEHTISIWAFVPTNAVGDGRGGMWTLTDRKE